MVARVGCKVGCGRCCGVVAFDRRTFSRLKSVSVRAFKEAPMGSDVWPLTRDGHCCFLKEDKSCAVYAYRPQVCRLYGTIKALECPYFKTDGTPRTREEVAEISERIEKEVGEGLKKLGGV